MLRNFFNDKNPVGQLIITFFIAITTMIMLFSIAMFFGYHIFGPAAKDIQNLSDYTNPSNINILKYYQMVQTLGLFLIPAIVLAHLFSGNSTHYLFMDRYSKKMNHYLLIIFIMVSAIPLINLLAYLNQNMQLPSFLHPVEEWFTDMEKTADKQTLAFMSSTTIEGLLINILMIGILPALAEELMFRGILQRIFTNLTWNVHWGILISSFIFSAIHMQFYGLFPRWVLGILFGYLLVWSGSMWAPILAHFVNNTIAVMVYFFINTSNLDERTLEIGAPGQLIISSVPAILLFTFCLYIFYKQNSGNSKDIYQLNQDFMRD